MNKYQTPRPEKMTARRLPVTELRPGSIVTLARDSVESRKLPGTVGACVGGSYGTVTEISPYGQAQVRVRVSHRRRVLTFIVPGSDRVIARMADVEPVPFTPLGLAVLENVPGAREMARGTSYALSAA